MKYTEIPESFKEEYYKKFRLMSDKQIKHLCKHDPTVFAYYMLDVKLRLHQSYAIDQIIKSLKKRVAFCWSRQLGKSILLGVFLIWATYYNKFPSTVAKITTSFIVSTNDDASVKLLQKIRDILYMADVYMNNKTAGKKYHTKHYFAQWFSEPNNTHQLTWKNGCFINSIPPTNKVLGSSASIFIIDEAANLDNEDPDTFYKKVVVPTTAETGGYIILSSTPEGISCFFYDNFDPEDKYKEHEYDRIWFNHKIYTDDSEGSEKYQEHVERERQNAEKEGKLKTWQQQYMACFTVTESSFFEIKDIESGIKDTPMQYEWKKTPCSVGYDYGIKNSRTVITVRTMIGNEIIQVFQYRCKPDFDTNLLTDPNWEHSIQNLKKRYSLSKGIIADDCPSGDTTNRWFESNSGLPVKKFNFRSDQMSKQDGLNRNCTWYSYRSKLKEGKLKIPKWNDRQIFEMKVVQEVEQKILITIKAPVGQLCDCVDSDMMASIPFLDMESNGDFTFDFTDSVNNPNVNTVPNRTVNRADNFRSPTESEIREAIQSGDLSSLEYNG